MSTNAYILSVILVLVTYLPSFSQAPTSKTNMKFYHIDVEVGLDKSHIKGSLYCEFVAIEESVKEIRMDLANQLRVSKIDGADAFQQKDDVLIITLSGKGLAKEERSNIKIYYEGEPPITTDEAGVKKGLVYGTHGKKDNPIIASVCYPNGGYLWFPCKKGLGDKVDSIYVDITIEDRKVEEIFLNPKTKQEESREMPLIAVSNGVLEVVEDLDGKKKYQWRHRHRIAPHHVLLAVSNFMKVESGFSGQGYKFPINFYIFPEKFKQSSAMMRRVPEIMTCLTNTFGPYPYRNEAFNVTQTGFSLGMDGMPTQTNVLLEDLKSTNMYRVVHQMASMWFGNRISPKDWQDAWITEALATYAEAMWQEYKRGLNVYQIILDEKEYFEGGKLYLDKREDFSEERLSKKGMYAIHMLRGIMSDTYFFETLKAITAGKRVRGKYSKTYLSTENFQEICEYYASENIERHYGYFFEQWVHGEYFPTYRVSYSVNSGKVMLNVNQETKSSTPNIFSIPYKIQIELQDGTVLDRVINDNQDKPIFTQADQNFEIPVSGAVKEVRFDPSNWIFKDLKYVRQVTNDKLGLRDFEIKTTSYRRKVTVSYEVPKKQDITIELFEVADGVALKEDKLISTQTFKKESGTQSHQFKIPLDLSSRGVYKLVTKSKGETYSKVLRLKQIKKIF